jgi:hypothetical protein
VISLIIHEVPLELWLQVTQIGIKDPFRQQLFDVGDALVSRVFEFSKRCCGDSPKAVAGRKYTTLGRHFRLAIGGYGIQRAPFINHFLVGLTVIAAGLCRHKAVGACSLGQLGYPHTGPVIDLAGEIWTKIAKRIIRKRRQMQNRIEANEIDCLDVANILANRRHLADFASRDYAQREYRSPSSPVTLCPALTSMGVKAVPT